MFGNKNNSLFTYGDWLVPVEVLQLRQVVGDAVQVVEVEDLLVVIIVVLSTGLEVVAVLLSAEPEGVVQVRIGVVSVEANVLGEVGQELLLVSIVVSVIVSVVVAAEVGVQRVLVLAYRASSSNDESDILSKPKQ